MLQSANLGGGWLFCNQDTRKCHNEEVGLANYEDRPGQEQNEDSDERQQWEIHQP